MNSFTTVAELEKFILEHGEHVVDILGAEVDRMERSIKVCGATVITIECTYLLPLTIVA